MHSFRSGTIQQTTTALTIGQVLPNDNNYNFNGILDDIRIFDYELSPAEITELASRVTSVNEKLFSAIPKVYALESYPNPFNPSTTIHFSLPAAEQVLIRIYDALGREVSTLVSERFPAGIFERQWTAGNQSSGVYFCVLTAANKRFTKKLLLMR